MPELTTEELEQVAEKLCEKLTSKKQALWVDPEIHHDDHEWIKLKRLDEQEIRELRKKALQSAVIWVVPIICGFVLALFWEAFKEAVSR